jgi:hypothetical protein
LVCRLHAARGAEVVKRAELPGHPRGADEYAMRRAKAIVRDVFGRGDARCEWYQVLIAAIAREIVKATRYPRK